MTAGIVNVPTLHSDEVRPGDVIRDSQGTYWQVDEMFGAPSFDAFGSDWPCASRHVAWPVTLIERAS